MTNALAQTARTATRVVLTLFGLALAGTGLAGLTFPEIMYSERRHRPGLVVDWMLNVGLIGYGLLLLASPQWLARHRWVMWTLAAMVLVFAGGLAGSLFGRLSLFQITAALLSRVWPAALAILLVESESRTARTAA